MMSQFICLMSHMLDESRLQHKIKHHPDKRIGPEKPNHIVLVVAWMFEPNLLIMFDPFWVKNDKGHPEPYLLILSDIKGSAKYRSRHDL